MSFSIKDLENLTGIKAHTIRIWEQRYNFLKPKRTPTNIRHYSNEELKNFLNVALLNRNGFRISQIEKMDQEEIRSSILSLDKIAAEDTVINDLIKAMTDADVVMLESLLNACIATSGIEKTISEIIYPFLERIGILWQSGNINPAQEHLVSNIIRQKIILAIDALRLPDPSATKACLFLPEGEFHEMSLLFVYYLLKKHGVNIIYVGMSTPLKDIETIYDLLKPKILYTHITTGGKNFNFEKFTNALANKFNGTQILISGKITTTYQKKLHEKIKLLHSLPEVIKFIQTIK